MFLTPEQLQALLDIVDQHHAAFVANYVSPQALTDAQVARLRAAGLLDPQAQSMRQAYLLGMVAAQLPAAGGAEVSYAELARRLQRDPVPLSPQERHAIGVAQLSAGQYISGLGAKVAGEVGAGLMQVDAATRAADREAYQQTTAQAVAQRRGVKGLASDLGHRTRDWTRSLERVANTELAAAYQAGTAQAIAKDHGDGAQVAKVVASDACQLCKSLLLEPDGRPKIFPLSELEGNGTNVGRRAAEARAVTGPIHPNCLLPGQPVMTCHGERPVEDLLPGDMVMTHRGRWRPVLRAWAAKYAGPAVELQVRGAPGPPLRATADHLFWMGGAFVAAGSLRGGSELASLLMATPAPPLRDPPRYLAQVARQRHTDGRWRTALATPWATYLQQDERPPEGPQNASRLEPLLGLFIICQAGLVRRRASRRAAGAGRPPAPEELMNRFLLVEQLPAKGVQRGVAPPLVETIGWSTETRQVVGVRRDADMIVFGEAPLRPAHRHAPPPRFVMRKVAAAARVDWRGTVYNLQVDEDESYQTGAAYSHNCGCTLVRVPPGMAYSADGKLVAERGAPR